MKSLFHLKNKIKSWLFKIELKSIKFKSKGENVHISVGFKVSRSENIEIGDHVYIGPDATLYGHGSIKIKSGVIIGPKCSVYSANHNFKFNPTAIPYDSKLIKKETTIYENVWIGGNVIIVPGITIGEGAVIGAGSVVTKNVQPFQIVGGNPATIIGTRDKTTYESLKRQEKIYLKIKYEK